jgi:lysozyme
MGIALLVEMEDYRDVPYQDAAGVWTDGFGNTEGVKPGQRTTVRKGFKKLIEHVVKIETALKNYIKHDLTQYEFDALVSFVYNIGVGAFARSTLLRLLNRGDIWGATQEFERWNRAGGRILPGLITRRQRERDLFRGIIN